MRISNFVVPAIISLKRKIEKTLEINNVMERKLSEFKAKTKTMAGAVKKVDFTAWLKEERKKEKSNTVIKKGRRKNANPVFQEYATYITDDFWKQFFINIGLGKYPKGFTWIDDQIVFRKGTKTVGLTLNDSANQNIIAIMDFFRAHGNIMSPKEIEELETERKEREFERSQVIQDWSHLPKQGKEQLLTNYASRLASEHKFDRDRYRKLLSTLYVGFIFGYFDKNNIVMNDMVIEDIDNLIYHKKDNVFYFSEGKSKANKTAKPTKKVGTKKITKNSDPFDIWCDNLSQCVANCSAIEQNKPKRSRIKIVA